MKNECFTANGYQGGKEGRRIETGACSLNPNIVRKVRSSNQKMARGPLPWNELDHPTTNREVQARFRSQTSMHTGPHLTHSP